MTAPTHKYTVTPETHHHVRVTVPADDGFRDPYRDAFARWPCDPAVFVAVEPIDCAELDTEKGK